LIAALARVAWFGYGGMHDLRDANECLSRQHLLYVLLYARCFWHSELIDRLFEFVETHCQAAVGFSFWGITSARSK
jgi:hypothetical protein